MYFMKEVWILKCFDVGVARGEWWFTSGSETLEGRKSEVLEANQTSHEWPRPDAGNSLYMYYDFKAPRGKFGHTKWFSCPWDKKKDLTKILYIFHPFKYVVIIFLRVKHSTSLFFTETHV